VRLVIRGMPMRMKFLGLAQVLSSATFIGLSVIVLATATTSARADTVFSDDFQFRCPVPSPVQDCRA
jgi:Na+/H+ antiporter NhaB